MKKWRYLMATALIVGSVAVSASAVGPTTVNDTLKSAITQLQQQWQDNTNTDYVSTNGDNYYLSADKLIASENLYKINFSTNDSQHKCGVANLKTGQIIIAPQYDTIDILANGKLLLTQYTPNTTSSFYYADLNGIVTEVKMPVQGMYMGIPNKGYIFLGVYTKRPLTENTATRYDIPTLVLMDENMHIIRDDIDGGIALSLPQFHNGLMPIQTGSTLWIGSVKSAIGNGKYGLIDQTGKFVSKNDFDEINWRDCRYIGKRGNSNYLLDGAGGETLLPSNINQESDWSKAEIAAAREHDLAIILYYPKLNISRLDFCELAVKLYQKVHPNAATSAVSAFTDCEDQNVTLAASLGIVTGYNDNTFRPYKTISRQEAATMLDRLYKALGGTVSTNSEKAFADDAQFGDWARESIYAMRQINIMQGKSGNKFFPRDGYTGEQAIVTIERMYNQLNK